MSLLDGIVFRYNTHITDPNTKGISVWRRSEGAPPIPGSRYYYTLDDTDTFPVIVKINGARETEDASSPIIGHMVKSLRITGVRQAANGFSIRVNKDELIGLMKVQSRSNRQNSERIWYWWSINGLPARDASDANDGKGRDVPRELNGQVFAVEVKTMDLDTDDPNFNWLHLRNTAPLIDFDASGGNEQTYDIPLDAGAVAGPPFIRVESWDANGTFRLTWDPPVDGERVDGYRVYMRKGGVWQLAWTTQSTSATIKNVNPSASKGLSIHTNPFIRAITTDGHSNGRIEGAHPTWTDVDDDTYQPSDPEEKKFYPATSVIWPLAQRQVYAGSEAEPTRAVFSEAGFFDRFGKSIPSSPSDSFIKRVATNRSERVRHLVPGANLICLTDQHEYRIEANPAGVDRDNVQARPESNYGSSWIPPIEAQNYLIMFDRTGSSMRTLRYSFETNSLNSEDLAILSKDLLRGRKITTRAYSDGETPQLFIGLEDGAVVVLSLFLEANVYGWWEIRTLGAVRGLAVVRDSTGLPFLHVTCERRRSARGIAGQGPAAPVIYTHEIMDTRGDSWALVDSAVSVEGRSVDGICVMRGNAMRVWLRDGDEEKIGIGQTTTHIFAEGLEQAFEEGQGFAVSDQVVSEPHTWSFERALMVQGFTKNARPEQADVDAGVSPREAWVAIDVVPDSPGPVDARELTKTTAKIYEGVKAITGLGHLTGELVDVRVGEKESLQDEEVKNGSVVFNTPVLRAVAGLGYGVLVETLDMLPEGDAGKAYSSVPRDITRVVVGSENPSQLAVGRKTRRNTGVDARESGAYDEEAGEVEVRLPPTSTNRRASALFVSQRAPVPFGLRSIMAEVVPGDMPAEDG